MTQLTPPKREQVQDLGRINWHNVFRPTFGDLLSAGYIDGASVLSFGSTITDLANTDGVVAFREGPKLVYPAALSGDTVYAVSSDGGDTQTYRVQGVDASGVYQDETVTLTGTTPAAVPGTWNHVQSCVNTSDGTTNAGTVYISTDAAAIPTTASDQIQVAMLAGDNYGINPEIVVPTGKTILIHRFDFSTDNNNSTKVRIEANRQGTWILNFIFYCDLEYHQDFLVPIRLFEGDRFRVTIEQSSGTGVNASFGMNGMVWSDTRVTNSKIDGGIGQLYAGI